LHARAGRPEGEDRLRLRHRLRCAVPVLHGDVRDALDPRPRAGRCDQPRGTHLIHALRRNVNIKILLFNNEIYGLTKGQYSPTSPLGKRTKSTPMGSLDWPFNPLSLAIGAEASFVARGVDTDRAHPV